jgi:phospholipase/lecithinase/hemolysin
MRTPRDNTIALVISGALVCVIALGTAVRGDSPRPLFLGLGDSIGEGVQSADANRLTQPFSYLNLIAMQMGAPFPLPLIQTGPQAAIFSTAGRSRVDPSVQGLNLAVSGATVNSLRLDAADAVSAADIDSETDMVLFPRVGSQLQVAETLRAHYVSCWIGSGDVLDAVTSFDHLDASQLTPSDAFAADLNDIANRLDQAGARVVFGTIPDVTRIGFLVDRQDLVRFLGSDFGLPPTSRTTIVAMFLVKLGLLPPATLTNPAYVLDAGEIQTISNHVAVLNSTIVSIAALHGFGVADIGALFDAFQTTPPVFLGVPLTARYLGGLLSLDGVHPSNIGHALIANAFIATFNQQFHRKIPVLDAATLRQIFLTDPFVDKNGDGRVAGRPGAGLLETLGPSLGISGDLAELSGAAATQSSSMATFFDAYAGLGRGDLRSASPKKRADAFRDIFGVPPTR